MKDYVQCKKCWNENARHDKFTDISLVSDVAFRTVWSTASCRSEWPECCVAHAHSGPCHSGQCHAHSEWPSAMPQWPSASAVSGPAPWPSAMQ